MILVARGFFAIYINFISSTKSSHLFFHGIFHTLY